MAWYGGVPVAVVIQVKLLTERPLATGNINHPGIVFFSAQRELNEGLIQ